MQLAPGIAEFIERSDEVFPPDYLEAPLHEQRAMYRALCKAFETPRPAGLTVEDTSVTVADHQVPVRIYRPEGVAAPSPCFLYMHGGGWVFGDLDSHDGVTAELAVRAQATVIAVDYRLAPEHPHPAASDDCWGVLQAVTGDPARFGIDSTRIVVGGDSAGGNLAAVLCLKAREAGGPPLAGQVHIYPGFGLRWDRPADAASEGQSGDDAPLLSQDEMLFYIKAYLGGATHTDDPYAAPLLNRDYGGLPPAYIMAVEHDPLREDAEAYAERLRAAGVPVELQVAPGLVHGCLRARLLCPVAAEAFEAVCAAAKRLLHG